MSLRLKLLLLGLATLVLPWGGCNYAREMELALREGEQNSLQAVSQTMAASLQGRTDLLYRETDDSASTAASEPAPAAGADRVKPGTYDLHVVSPLFGDFRRPITIEANKVTVVPLPSEVKQ